MGDNAQKIAEIYFKHYEGLRTEIQTLIGRGDFQNYAAEEWLNADGVPTSEADVLSFKDAKSAYEYACKFMTCDFSARSVIAGLVEQVHVDKDELQTCRLCLPEGRAVLFCTTISKQVPPLRVGDLVAYFIGAVFPEASASSFGHMGFIVAKLEPTISISRGWKVANE